MNKSSPKPIANNRKASFQYQLGARFEAGLVLEGWEVVAIRQGQVQLAQSYISLKSSEAWLIGAHISPLSTTTHQKADPLRERKLLLQRKELKKLIGQCQLQGETVAPVKLYFKNGKIKLEIALATGKKMHDKRQSIKERDLTRYEDKQHKQRGYE
ncbi:SsrA-binding protein SmpB [Gammaproteobacteria bacterium]|nr:SsrA-binding protein SmpB [Gammaproteobacteria bacterium]